MPQETESAEAVGPVPEELKAFHTDLTAEQEAELLEQVGTSTTRLSVKKRRPDHPLHPEDVVRILPDLQKTKEEKTQTEPHSLTLGE